MDDGANPHLGIIGRIVKFLKEMWHRLPFVQKEDVTEEEIISMVNEGHEQGVLLESEAEMIHNIFEFDEKEAKDIMTHRKNIAALDDKATLEDAIHFIVESRFSRCPVYQESIDNIVGILHIKEALAFSLNASLYHTPISEIKGLVREVHLSRRRETLMRCSVKCSRRKTIWLLSWTNTDRRQVLWQWRIF